MNNADESHQPQAPLPATAIASHRVHPDKAAEYIAAQTAITDAARRFPGFVGTEVLRPVIGIQEEWVAIFRLESNRAMKQWLESPMRRQLTERIETSLLEPSRMLILASDENSEPPVAMVFTHRVARERVADYLAWRRKAIAAQAHFPGYLATEFFEPHGKQDEWVDVVRYSSLKDLENWMESKERRDLIDELDTIVESRHAHRVTGLEGWFAVNRADTPINVPPPWKQALTVLFALYPTVMALTFLNPLWQNRSLPVQMLFGNILSVALLTWLIMPAVSRLLGFWLESPTRDWKNEALGLSTVAIGLLLFVLIFRAL
jgi:hypothetical protein